MNTRTVPATDDTFDEETASGLTLVDFWAPWCGSCGVTGPTIERVAERYAGRVKVVQVNADENKGLSARFRIQALPMLLLLRDGVITEDLTSRTSVRAISEVLERHLGENAGSSTAAP